MTKPQIQLSPSSTINAVLLGLTILFSPVLAHADAPSFSYIEVEYVASGDLDISDDSISASADLDGFAITGSIELGIFILQASRFELEGDGPLNSTLEDSISTLALGLAFEVGNAQLYGLARVRQDELTATSSFLGSLEEDATSGGAEVGIRWNLTDRFELNANIGTPALDQGTSIGAGAQFFITKNIGITAEYNSIEIEENDIEAEIDTFSVGLRYSF